MKVESFEIRLMKIPLVKPFVTSLRRVEFVESIVIIIKTDSGLVGYGESVPTKEITGDTKERILDALKVIKNNLLEKNFNNFKDILNIVHNSIDKNSSAKSAVEIAIYDIASKRENLPLYKFLGGSFNTIETSVTVSLGSIESMVKEVEGLQREEIYSFKIKLGGDIEEDLLRFSAIQRVLDPSAKLKLDANQGWSVEETLYFLKKMKGVKVELLEQPIKADDIEGLSYIRKNSKVKIMADESVFSLEDVKKVVALGAADIINIKLDKCGGISKALEIIEFCKRSGVECMMGCMLEGSISVSAAANLAIAKSDIVTFYDLDAPLLFSNNPIKGGVVYNKNIISPSESMGIGCVLPTV